jgi:CheY-like chemotaxis protein
MGTGLGLSQVCGLVKQSGGHVKIYSEAERGTSVKLYLRREMIADVAVNPSSRSEDTPIPLGLAAEIILVVEDEDSGRAATVASLRELGYTVRYARFGPEALEVLDQQPGAGVAAAFIGSDRHTPGELPAAGRRRRSSTEPTATAPFVTALETSSRSQARASPTEVGRAKESHARDHSAVIANVPPRGRNRALRA